MIAPYAAQSSLKTLGFNRASGGWVEPIACLTTPQASDGFFGVESWNNYNCYKSKFVRRIHQENQPISLARCLLNDVTRYYLFIGGLAFLGKIL